MIRCGAEAALAAGLVLLAGTAAGATTCLDWSSPAVMAEEGTLRGLPSGPLRWRIGRAAATGAEMTTAVQLRWTSRDGAEQRQMLFEGPQSGRPHLSLRQGRLHLHLTFCPATGSCRDTVLGFAFDPAAGRFIGTDPAARAVLEAPCGAEGG